MNTVKYKYIIAIGLSVILSSCWQNRKNQNSIINNTINQTDMDTLVINEKKIREYFDEYVNVPIPENAEDEKEYYISEEDFKIVIPLIYNSLKRNGFRFISDSAYQEKLKDIFGITPNTKSKQLINHTDFMSYIVVSPYDSSLTAKDIALIEFFYGNVFFIKKYNFISPLAKISDYVKFDNNKIVNITSPTIIYRNKYLFNDSKASLTWLINNDMRFLELLVKEFGYDKDPQINKAVLEKINKEYSTNLLALDDLFAKKDYNGQLQIHEGLLKYISETTTKENQDFLSLLDDYCTIINDMDKVGRDLDKRQLERLYGKFSPQERAKIITYILYYIQKLLDPNEDYESFTYSVSNTFYMSKLYESFIFDEIKKNNYYNLPGLKDMLDRVDTYISDKRELKEEYDKMRRLE